MQAIRTRYYGPTDSRGSRIIARCGGGSVTMPYSYALNTEGNHAAAAQLLLQKLNWARVYFGGCFNGDYYWVCPSDWMPVASIESAQSEAA
jgi:hypothetical protein